MSHVWHCLYCIQSTPVPFCHHRKHQTGPQGTEAFPLSLQNRPVTDSPKAITPAGHTDYAIATVGEESELPPPPPAHAAGPIAPNGQGDHGRVKHAQSRNHPGRYLCQGQVSRTVASTSPATAPAVDVWEALVCGRQSRLMSKYSKDKVRVSCEAGWVFYPPIYPAGCISSWARPSRNTGLLFLVSRLPSHVPQYSFVPCMTNPY